MRNEMGCCGSVPPAWTDWQPGTTLVAETDVIWFWKSPRHPTTIAAFVREGTPVATGRRAANESRASKPRTD